MALTAYRPRTLLALLALLFPAGGMVPSAQAETQTFNLAAQWNLISFQIIPDDPSPEAVFSTLPGFQAAWSYDARQLLWRRYVQPSGTPTQQANDATGNALLELPPIEPGRAYWVFTSQAVPAWEVSGTVPADLAFRSLDLQPGWNLIGIPVGAASVANSEPVSLLAVLTAAGFDYDALLTWENQTFRKMFRPQLTPDEDPPNPLEGLPPDLPFPTFNLNTDLGRGYWIRVLDPAVLRPRLVTTVRPDIDTEPVGNFPAKEDLNVSGGAIPASVEEQDTIRFFPGEDVQTLSVANIGDGVSSGGGIILWEATWIPVTDLDTPEPWIRLFSSPSEKERRDETGQLIAQHTQLTGVTTLENDIIYLRLDRQNLGRGAHEGTLRLRTSAGHRSYRVVAEVPGLEGDFQGYATIQSVNGKRNPVPDVDLFVSFYEDNKVDGLLRGVIDSSQVLLWPVDVPLVGYRIADEGNQFVLGGSFVLPPGDQNGEPFDRWNENDPTAGTDVDWLNDGLLDVRNPFPFPIQRTVSLEGALVRANPTDGYVLEGKYTEIVHGMSRQPLVLAGVFHLERRAPRPLSTRKFVTSDTGIEPVVTRQNTLPVVIPAGSAGDSAVSIVTEMELQALQVSLAFNAPLPHPSLRIVLRSPETRELVLYDGTNPEHAVNPKLLERVTFPLDRPTQGDLEQFLRSITRTSTEPTPGQFWRLLIQNNGPTAVTLASWSLRLDGQPVADVYGVVKTAATPLAGVRVVLDGLPFSLSSNESDNDGNFKLSRVPLLPLNFSALRPGFGPANPAAPGLDTVFTRPFVGQAGLSFTTLESQLISRFNPLAGAPPALAGVPGFAFGTATAPFELQLNPDDVGQPSIAGGPLRSAVGTTVEFYPLNVGPDVSWDFGDGTTGDQTIGSHVYSLPGVYHVRLFSPPNSTTPQASVELIALPAPGRALIKPSDLGGQPSGLDPQTAEAEYVAHVFQPHFSFAGTIPARKVGVDPDSGADLFLSDITPKQTFATGETNEFGAAFVSMMPIQHAYAAAMDTDLAPRLTPANTSRDFGDDGFLPLPSPGFDASINVNSQGFKNDDFNYAHVASLWQNTRAIDGAVEYDQDAQNGLILWGNTLVVPNQNYSIQTHEARDGTDFTFARDENTYHPHKGTTTVTDLATHSLINHYRVACSLGPVILVAPTASTAVKPAKARRSQPDNPLDPDLLTAAAPIARNLHYQLRSGPFATPHLLP
jgi:hypothetical protein